MLTRTDATLSVAIVDAGRGGLTAASTLRRYGFDGAWNVPLNEPALNPAS